MDSIINLNSIRYRFRYENDHTPLVYGMKLEDIIVQIANQLKGAHYFLREQKAALVVIGYDMYYVPYVLNKPSEWALERYREENGRIIVREERIGNDEIVRISVRNMKTEGESSEILLADVFGANSRYAYGSLNPIRLECNTQELDSLMTELMNLHLLKVSYSKSLSWLRRLYGH